MYICIHIYAYKYIHICICIYVLLGNCVTSGLDQRALSSAFVGRFVVVSLCLGTAPVASSLLAAFVFYLFSLSCVLSRLFFSPACFFCCQCI